eukprot:CAMPEP_0115020262 /NCGR_PEP_ID=MMETSP0216-20121206/29983_1 /TAXON_ID=223996 /ORGANISM="Protocruzia adherens, Strain Boccale" /LENGTH=192 /DNA_ID=CAMNT_0002391987 /DNA_START=16 /DNA_END=594 /DNA_ORIENTATION=-
MQSRKALSSTFRTLVMPSFRGFATSTEKTVPVYEAPDFKDLEAHSSKGRESFADYVHKNYNEKYFKLLPFLLEDSLTRVNKKFALKMDLLPDREYLRVHWLGFGGVRQSEIPISDVIPVTPHDLDQAHAGRMATLPPFVDDEMTYMALKCRLHLVFDKEGKWHEEGVNDPMLSLENNYHERKWMDEVNLNNK